MEGKNRVKCAYQQTVENRVKSAQEVGFVGPGGVLSTICCGEICLFWLPFRGFHIRSVEKPGFCGKARFPAFEKVDLWEIRKFAGRVGIPI
jgi:hypothetical protein